MHAAFAFLAQIPIDAVTSGEPRIDPEPSSILTLLLGGLFCVFVLIFTFKTPRRNYVQE